MQADSEQSLLAACVGWCRALTLFVSLFYSCAVSAEPPSMGERVEGFTSPSRLPLTEEYLARLLELEDEAEEESADEVSSTEDDESQDDSEEVLGEDEEEDEDDDSWDDDSYGDLESDDDDSFPALPPDPYEDEKEELPEVYDELWHHGGSYLYFAEGNPHSRPHGESAHAEHLRLPADWLAPKPFTAFAEFQGADAVKPGSRTWFGPGAYSMEPRFVGYGSYELLGFAFEQAGNRRDAIGHQLLIDLDLRLTGTERFHVQFRPFGERNTGGSYYQFNDPSGYENNHTLEPDRYWFEGEIHSVFGWGKDYYASHATSFLVGKFPFVLHNSLLMNDDIVGGTISRNNLILGNLSNLNLQLFTGLNDVDTYPAVETQVYGLHASIDYKRVFYEATVAYLNAELDRDAMFAGFSRTKFYGPLSIATRGLFKWGDEVNGSGQLFTIESNWTRIFDHAPCGIHHGVFFCNAFWATEGWNSISGGNQNRLRTAFEVDPLARLAAAPAQVDTLGVAFGVQLFRHHDDESLIPEIAWESRGGDTVFGVGMRYQKKLSARSFLELFGVKNWSRNRSYEREGVFISHSWLF